MSALRVPRALRDPAFRRRFAALDRATTDAQRAEVLAEPLVAERVYDPDPTHQVECPAGDTAVHPAEPHAFLGTTFMARRCETCGNGWWEAAP